MHDRDYGVDAPHALPREHVAEVLGTELHRA